jgi:hypothetical protein
MESQPALGSKEWMEVNMVLASEFRQFSWRAKINHIGDKPIPERPPPVFAVTKPDVGFQYDLILTESVYE